MQQRGPRIALWGLYDVDSYGDCLDARIFEHELERRLPHARVDVFAPLARDLPAKALCAPAPLGRDNGERRADFAQLYDLVAIGGEVVHGRAVEYERLYGTVCDPSSFFIEGLGEEHVRRCPVAWHAVGMPFDLDGPEAQRVAAALDSKAHFSVRDELSLTRLRVVAPDREVAVVGHPALFVRRILDDTLLEKRLDYIRVLDWYPAREAPIVLQSDALFPPQVESIAAALEQVDAEHPIVLLELSGVHERTSVTDELGELLDRPHYRIDRHATVEDVAAAIGHAHAFVGSSAAGLATALAFGVPAHPVPTKQLSAAVPAGPASRERLTEQLDLHFDRLADLAQRSWKERMTDAGDAAAAAAALGRALAEAEERVDLVRRGYEARGERLVAERLRFAEIATAGANTTRAEELALRNAELENQVQLLDAAEAAMRSERDELAAEVEHLRAELVRRRARPET